MTSEDFSQYGLAGASSVLLHIGAVDAAKLAAARQSGTILPGPHSPQWAPEREPTLKAAITAETAALLDFFGSKWVVLAKKCGHMPFAGFPMRTQD